MKIITQNSIPKKPGHKNLELGKVTGAGRSNPSAPNKKDASSVDKEYPDEVSREINKKRKTLIQ